jgi:hypothetical protein
MYRGVHIRAAGLSEVRYINLLMKKVFLREGVEKQLSVVPSC